jgi:hypothetical protein
MTQEEKIQNLKGIIILANQYLSHQDKNVRLIALYASSKAKEELEDA